MQYSISHNIPADHEELLALQTSEQVHFVQFAQEMEMLGILVAEKYIDLDLVDKTLGSSVSTSCEKYKGLTLGARKADPFLNEYFQWLAEKISERMSNNPRKPFHAKNRRLL
jgi:hypothetical protein